MNYTRLTRRFRNSQMQQDVELMTTVSNGVYRLAELEDKIEQGTLKEEKTCKNISEMHPSDGFTCSECGITIIDFREEIVDEDYLASWYEYEFKYCPNCGAKVND